MGRIVDVLVDRSGEVRAAIIDFGGFLGVGSRKIAVDWDALHFPASCAKVTSIRGADAQRRRHGTRATRGVRPDSGIGVPLAPAPRKQREVLIQSLPKPSLLIAQCW